jgi:hypothetical protein
MATKLARQIAAFLVGHDRIMPFRSNGTADLIDKVLDGRTIKKSEVEQLRKLDEECSMWVCLTVKACGQAQDFRAKLWNAEQEISDLKKLCGHANERLTERNKTVAKLLHNGINLAAELRRVRTAHDQWREKYLRLLGWHCDLLRELNTPREFFHPPACLNTFDALEFQRRVVATPPNSGPY